MADSPSELSQITDDVPATALSISSRNKLSRNLNYDMPIRGNNWKGLADELQFPYVDICNLERESDPTGELIKMWSCKEDTTISKLINALKEIERYDVLTAVKDSFEKDADRYIKDKEESKIPLQVQEVSPSSGESYDAFVCYTEKDYPFVMEMMEKLERSRPRNQPQLKLCVEFRDILPGVAWTEAAVDLIGRKCKRMIVVLSPDFKGTPQCDFQTKFALSLAPGTQSRRIIPIMYKQCEIPEILGHLTICNYTKKDLRPWFWERLAQTLSLS